MVQWVVLFTVAILGSADIPDPAKEGKMAAVNKVIEMLDSLQEKVIEEGHQEALTYEKFACFCKDKQKDKQDAIKAAQDAKDTDIAMIEEDTSHRDDVDEHLTTLASDIDDKSADMKKWKREHQDATHEYNINAADLSNAIRGLEGAINVMKVNKDATPAGEAFLQMPEDLKETVQSAALMADALGLTSGKSVSALLQAPAGSLIASKSSVSKIEPYAFQGNGIIETMEKLETDFKDAKAKLDEDEKKRKEVYEADMKDGEEFVAKKEDTVEVEKVDKSDTTADIATESEDMTGINNQLLDDQAYLKELTEMCQAKAKTYDQRVKTRTDELGALVTATGIIKSTVAEKTSSATMRLIQQRFSAKLAEATVHDDAAMEDIEADAEEQEDSTAGAAPLGFLQKRSKSSPDAVEMAEREMEKSFKRAERTEKTQKKEAPAPVSVKPVDSKEEGAREMVLSMLKQRGVQTHSSMLMGLATRIAGDPFAKIKKLIQELIERSLAEASNEANQKGWCDKNIEEGEQKRDTNAAKNAKLNAKSAKLEARRDKLTEDLDNLAQEIDDLSKSMDEADKMRAEEKAENHETVKEAQTGLDAVKEAIDVLDKFYKTQKKHAKVDLDFLQKKAKGPLDDAPDTIETGEAYKGNQGAATGILGMLAVIESDFERTIKQTEAAEAKAEDDKLKFDTKSKSSFMEKTVATKQKHHQLDETLENLEKTRNSMDETSELLQTAIKELIELQPACVDTGMSYAERVAAREDDINSLKKALCMFEAFIEFGPDAAGADC